MQTETWFEVEFRRGADQDWIFLAGADTVDLCREELEHHKVETAEFEYRIIKKTMTIEVLQ